MTMIESNIFRPRSICHMIVDDVCDTGVVFKGYERNRHLEGIYQLFNLALINIDEYRHWKVYFSPTFFSALIDLLDSEDPHER